MTPGEAPYYSDESLARCTAHTNDDLLRAFFIGIGIGIAICTVALLLALGVHG